MTSADGRATVTFAAGAVSDPVAVTITPVSSGLGTAYDLKAVDASGNEIHTFAIDPVLTISYAGTPPTGIDYVDPVNGPQQISSTVDAAAHTISATLPHFSTFTSTDTFTVALIGVPSTSFQNEPTTVFVQVYDNTTKTLQDNAPVTITLTGAAATATATSDCPASGSDFTSGAAGMCPVTITPTDPSGTVHIVASLDGVTNVTTDSADLAIQNLTGNAFSATDNYQVIVASPGVTLDNAPLPVQVVVIDTTTPGLTQDVPLDVSILGPGTLTAPSCTLDSHGHYLTQAGGVCSFIFVPAVQGVAILSVTVTGTNTPQPPSLTPIAILPSNPSTSWSVPTGTNDSAAVTTSSKNLTVTLGDPTVFTVPLFDLDTTNAHAVTIDGSASSLATTFDLSGIAAHFSNLVTLLGGSAADIFNLGNGYGNVSITGASSDKLSFDQNTQSVDYNGTNFTDGVGGDTASVSGVTKIDLSLNGNTVTLTQLENKLDSLFTAIASAVTTVDQANAQLSAALPLLGQSGSSSIDKIVGFVDAFGGVAQQIHSHLVGFSSLDADTPGRRRRDQHDPDDAAAADLDRVRQPARRPAAVDELRLGRRAPDLLRDRDAHGRLVPPLVPARLRVDADEPRHRARRRSEHRREPAADVRHHRRAEREPRTRRRRLRRDGGHQAEQLDQPDGERGTVDRERDAEPRRPLRVDLAVGDHVQRHCGADAPRPDSGRRWDHGQRSRRRDRPLRHADSDRNDHEPDRHLGQFRLGRADRRSGSLGRRDALPLLHRHVPGVLDADDEREHLRRDRR